MVTLANLQGGSLVADITSALNDIGELGKRLRTERAVKGTLGGQPDQTGGGPLGFLNQLAPDLAPQVTQNQSERNPIVTSQLRQKADENSRMTNEIRALPTFADKQRRLREEAAKVSAQGGDISNFVDLSNLTEDELDLKLEKTGMVADAVRDSTPPVTDSETLNFLDTPQGRAQFAKLSAENPAMASALLTARENEQRRLATAREKELARTTAAAGQERFVPVTDAAGNIVGQRSTKTGKVVTDPRAGAAPQLQTGVGKLISDQQIVIDQFGADSPQAKAVAEALESEQKGEAPKLSDVSGIRKEFTTLSGDFITMRDAVGKVRVAAERGTGTESAASDLALVFNYMKILDPNSVVRESEFATAENARGVPDTIRNIHNKVLAGEILGEAQRQDFLASAEGLFQSQVQKQTRLEKEFTGIAERSDIDPAQVVIDFRGEQQQQETQQIFDDLPSGAEVIFNGKRFRKP